MSKFPAVILLCLLSVGCGSSTPTEYKSAQGKFKILFAGSPKLSQQTGQNNTKVQSYEVSTSSGSYLVNHYDVPMVIPENRPIQANTTGATGG